MILDFFVLYAFACSVILLASCIGLSTGYYCAILKDRYSIQKQQLAYWQIYKKLLTASSQCEEVRNTLQQKKPKIWPIPCRVVAKKNIPPCNSLITVIHRYSNALTDAEQNLKTIQEELELARPEPDAPYRKAPLFLYTGVSIIGLLLTTQTLTAFLCLLLVGTIHMGLIAGSMPSNAFMPSSVLSQYHAIHAEIFSFENSMLPEAWVRIMIASVCIILSILLVTRLIRFLVSQFEILFIGYRISIAILLSDLTKDQLTEQVEEMYRNIRLRNSSCRIGNILHRLFD